MMVELSIIWLIVTAVSAVAGAALLVFSKRRQFLDKLEIEHRNELVALAETRKEVIDQLRSEVAEMGKQHAVEIADLNKQIAELRGQYEAMRRFQVQEIIDGVTRGVLNGLALLDPES